MLERFNIYPDFHYFVSQSLRFLVWRPSSDVLSGRRCVLVLDFAEKKFFLCMQDPKIVFLGADIGIGFFFFFGKHSLHIFFSWCKWLYFFDDLPFDFEVDVFVCQFPNVFPKCCRSYFMFELAR